MQHELLIANMFSFAYAAMFSGRASKFLLLGLSVGRKSC